MGPEELRQRMSVAAVIPARDESETIGSVVEVARRSPSVTEALVVVEATDPATAAAAQRAGARVVKSPGGGKGEAMAAGVRATEAEVILFLDGDLLGLTTEHTEGLVRPVLDGRVWMAAGLFDRGAFLNWFFLHTLPNLTGERALRRELFDALRPEEIRGYRVEAALNAAAAVRRVPTMAFVCDGMWHRVKERKMANPLVGFVSKVGMIVAAVWSSISYRIGRIAPRRRQAAARQGEGSPPTATPERPPEPGPAGPAPQALP